MPFSPRSVSREYPRRYIGGLGVRHIQATTSAVAFTPVESAPGGETVAYGRCLRKEAAMQISLRKLLSVALACAACSAGWAQQQSVEPTAEQPASAAPLWPSRFQAGEDEFTVYPPQLERWEGDRLE